MVWPMVQMGFGAIELYGTHADESTVALDKAASGMHRPQISRRGK
jgi:hypothetical protein